MDDLGKLGTFTINANLELMIEVQDINDCMDDLVSGLFGNTDVPTEVWDILMVMRTRLDKITKHCMVLPSIVHRLAPHTHVPRHVDEQTPMELTESEKVPAE